VNDAFFDEFSNLLEPTAAYASPVIIAGDINIHLDTATDQNTVTFVQLLDARGLTQHVTGATHATHRGGHCLGVLITPSDLHVPSVCTGLPMLSDHSQIVAELDLRAP